MRRGQVAAVACMDQFMTRISHLVPTTRRLYTANRGITKKFSVLRTNRQWHTSLPPQM